MATELISTMNNTAENTESTDGIPVKLQYTVNGLILIFALFGNVLLVSSLLRSKRLRESITNMLISNLAFCDIFLVTISLVATSIETKVGEFPFGEFGCKIVYPVSTLAIISSVFTLVLLSLERYFAIVHPFRYRHLKRFTLLAIVCCHLFSIICVIPYSYNLKLTYADGYTFCGETWSAASSAGYTIFMFTVQYALPLPIIVSLYTYSWFRVKRQNDEVIRVAEQQRQRVGLIDEDLLTRAHLELIQKYQQSNSKQGICKRIAKFASKRKTGRTRTLSSQLAVNRQKQTMSMLKSFIFIVTVFAICMLPNQITWLCLTVGHRHVSNTWLSVAYWLTYANCVLNPIIYGINPKFRKAYARQIRRFSALCFYKISRSRFGSTFTSSSYTTGETEFSMMPDISSLNGSPSWKSNRRAIKERIYSTVSNASADSYCQLVSRSQGADITSDLIRRDSCNSTEKDVFYSSDNNCNSSTESVPFVVNDNETSVTDNLKTTNTNPYRSMGLYRSALRNSIKRRRHGEKSIDAGDNEICFHSSPTLEKSIDSIDYGSESTIDYGSESTTTNQYLHLEENNGEVRDLPENCENFRNVSFLEQLAPHTDCDQQMHEASNSDGNNNRQKKKYSIQIKVKEFFIKKDIDQKTPIDRKSSISLYSPIIDFNILKNLSETKC